MLPCLPLCLLIVMNGMSLVESKVNRLLTANMTCVTIPMASLSSRSDDRFSQLKLFASPHLTTNSTTCAKFDM